MESNGDFSMTFLRNTVFILFFFSPKYPKLQWSSYSRKIMIKTTQFRSLTFSIFCRESVAHHWTFRVVCSRTARLVLLTYKREIKGFNVCPTANRKFHFTKFNFYHTLSKWSQRKSAFCRARQFGMIEFCRLSRLQSEIYNRNALLTGQFAVDTIIVSSNCLRILNKKKRPFSSSIGFIVYSFSRLRRHNAW